MERLPVQVFSVDVRSVAISCVVKMIVHSCANSTTIVVLKITPGLTLIHRNQQLPRRVSLPTPIRHGIVAGLGELMLIRSVGQHGPDLGAAADGSLKHDVAIVRSP
jgi:hypothetical protein